MLDLIIVTGASKGIGRSIATKCSFACKNMIVMASSDAINHIEDYNKDCNVIPLQVNLINHSLVQEALDKVLPALKDINSIGLVLAAANIGNAGGIFDSDLNDWGKQYCSNVLGNLSVIKACESLIRKQIKSRIVMFAGGGAAYGYPDFSGYALSKVAVVRAVENISMELAKINEDASIIAIAPGAVATDTLQKVIDGGGMVKTKTDISEPTNFVYNFLMDEFPSQSLNGLFLHVRDDLFLLNADKSKKNLFKLRRVE